MIDWTALELDSLENFPEPRFPSSELEDWMRRWELLGPDEDLTGATSGVEVDKGPVTTYICRRKAPNGRAEFNIELAGDRVLDVSVWLCDVPDPQAKAQQARAALRRRRASASNGSLSSTWIGSWEVYTGGWDDGRLSLHFEESLSWQDMQALVTDFIAHGPSMEWAVRHRLASPGDVLEPGRPDWHGHHFHDRRVDDDGSVHLTLSILWQQVRKGKRDRAIAEVTEVLTRALGEPHEVGLWDRQLQWSGSGGTVTIDRWHSGDVDFALDHTPARPLADLSQDSLPSPDVVLGLMRSVHAAVVTQGQLQLSNLLELLGAMPGTHVVEDGGHLVATLPGGCPVRVWTRKGEVARLRVGLDAEDPNGPDPAFWEGLYEQRPTEVREGLQAPDRPWWTRDAQGIVLVVPPSLPLNDVMRPGALLSACRELAKLPDNSQQNVLQALAKAGVIPANAAGPVPEPVAPESLWADYDGPTRVGRTMQTPIGGQVLFEGDHPGLVDHVTLELAVGPSWSSAQVNSLKAALTRAFTKTDKNSWSLNDHGVPVWVTAFTLAGRDNARLMINLYPRT